MSYTYTAILQVRNSSGRFVDYTNAATITAHDLAGNAIPGASLTNRGTGFYVAAVTQNDLEDVVFRIVPHLDDQPLHPDQTLIHERVVHTLDDGVDDIVALINALPGEYDAELLALQTDITTIVTDYARRTGDYAPANEYDAELLALQADITTIVTDYARRTGDYAIPNEYDAELLALQTDITTIVTDYARRTGDYAIPNEYDAELLALQTDITTIVTDYARRVGDYAPPNEYDAELDVAVSTRLASADYTAPDNATIAAIEALVTALMGVGWTDETLVQIVTLINGLPGATGTIARLDSILSSLRYNPQIKRYMREGTIEIKRSADMDVNVYGLGELVGRSTLYFTVKKMSERDDVADAQSIIQIEETAGLLYINKGAPSAPANGAITVTDAAAGHANITLAAIETNKLTPNEKYCYDIKMDNAVLGEGKFLVSTAITRTVT